MATTITWDSTDIDPEYSTAHKGHDDNIGSKDVPKLQQVSSDLMANKERLK
jgi:hypothetical protein